jgi:hypothetical protein
VPVRRGGCEAELLEPLQHLPYRNIDVRACQSAGELNVDLATTGGPKCFRGHSEIVLHRIDRHNEVARGRRPMFQNRKAFAEERGGSYELEVDPADVTDSLESRVRKKEPPVDASRGYEGGEPIRRRRPVCGRLMLLRFPRQRSMTVPASGYWAGPLSDVTCS